MELGGGFALNLNIPETQPQDVQGPSMVRYSATCVYFFLAKEKQVEKLKSVPVGIIYHIYPRVNKYLDMPYGAILQTTLAEKTTSSSTSQPFPDLNWSFATEKKTKKHQVSTWSTSPSSLLGRDPLRSVWSVAVKRGWDEWWNKSSVVSEGQPMTHPHPFCFGKDSLLV